MISALLFHARAMQNAAAFLMAAGLATLALMPDVPDVVANQDKLEHVLGFFALSMVWLWRVQRMALRVALLIILGAAIEVAQSLAPSHTASATDALFSFGGVLVGCLTAYAAEGLGRRRRHSHERGG